MTAMVRRPSWRALVISTTLAAAAVGYAVVPQQPAVGATPGVVLGGVPKASAPTSGTIVIGKDAADHGYSTKVVTISQGATLNVVNEDNIDHTVTSVGTDSSGTALFDHTAAPGSTTSIPAASKLAPGRYKFYCRFHPSVMRGTLVVEQGDGGGGTHPEKLKYEQPLKTPKILSGSHLRIPVRSAKVRVLPHGPLTRMWTFGGSYPGPTIERPAGKDTKVTFVNKLPAKAGPITVHLHGDHHRWQDDGQPDRFLIHRGASRTYDYPLTDNGRPETEAFDWYHDHLMSHTASDNWHGLQGMFIMSDPHERKLRLPSGKHQIPLMFSDRTFTKHNQLTNPFAGRDASSPGKTGPQAPPGDGVVGKQVLVDGRFAPYQRVAQHRYRLQLLNSSSFETYDFQLSDGRPFVQIGTGNDLLPKPVVRQDILLGPAQRADVIVDFHGELHKRVLLQTVSKPHGAPVGVGSPTASLMQFRVTRNAADHTRIPSRLEAPPRLKAPKKISMRWTFGLGGNATSGTYWTVNGKPFDPHRVDIEVPRGKTETWLLKNNSPVTHFIHLHEEQWHTVKIDGKPPPPWERGLEDTWRLDPGESIEVAARFSDYTGIFMLHCHMLVHEDDGMMAQFAVVKPGTHKLPHGYYYKTSQRAAAAERDSPMSTSMQMPAAGVPAADAPQGWSRLVVRSSRAIALELFMLVVALAYRRFRRQGWAAV